MKSIITQIFDRVSSIANPFDFLREFFRAAIKRLGIGRGFQNVTLAPINL
jgi:hypothetical protein